jgi:hypothetical protein
MTHVEKGLQALAATCQYHHRRVTGGLLSPYAASIVNPACLPASLDAGSATNRLARQARLLRPSCTLRWASVAPFSTWQA